MDRQLEHSPEHRAGSRLHGFVISAINSLVVTMEVCGLIHFNLTKAYLGQRNQH